MRHKGVKMIGHTCGSWCWMHLNAIQLLISFFFCTETKPCLKKNKMLRKVTVFTRNNRVIKWIWVGPFGLCSKQKEAKERKLARQRELENRLFREGGALALGPWAQKVLQCCITNSLTGKHLSATLPFFFLFPPH